MNPQFIDGDNQFREGESLDQGHTTSQGFEPICLAPEKRFSGTTFFLDRLEVGGGQGRNIVRIGETGNHEVGNPGLLTSG